MHIVLASIEKMVPTIEDCTSLLRVLARSATGQDFSVYTTFSTGARRPGDLDGPDEYHVVLVDNGRSAMLGTEFQEMLRCIRCAACMNHCPVYGAVGGHAYGWVYPGPMGAVLTPALIGVDAGRTSAERLHLLRQVRERLPGEDPAAQADAPLARARVRAPPDAAGGAHQSGAVGLLRAPPRAVSAGDARGGDGRWDCWAASTDASSKLPFAGGWTGGRDLPAPEGDTFFARYAREQRAGRDPMSKDAMLAAIRRGLRRGALPEDQAAMLRGRLASHPRHLIPGARRDCRTPSRSSCSSPIVEKEFGSVARVPDLDAVPEAVADYLAAQNLPTDIVMAPHPELQAIPWADAPAAAAARGPRRGVRHGQPAARLRRHRGDRHADAALGAGAPDDAEPAGGYRDRAAARLAPSSAPTRKPGTCCAPRSAACRATSCW